jgi:hypothetical protein
MGKLVGISIVLFLLPLPEGQTAGMRGAMMIESPSDPHPARHPLSKGERETILAQSTEPAPSAPSSADLSIHAYGDRDKTCIAWTDKCRTCERAADDQIHCSNIGIACQPAEIACTARKTEPAK